MNRPQKRSFRLLESLIRAWTLIWVGACALACTASDELPVNDSPPPTVLLISMDGTRPADLTEETLPSLVALGVAAPWPKRSCR